jgi:signal transduction histidine kinase/CheY-like chemotaxis protein
MPEWILKLLDVLAQVTGSKGGISSLSIFIFAGACYLMLLVIARAKYKEDRSPREYYLQWGFALGLAHEAFMLVLGIIQELKWIEREHLHMVFPPLEHTLFAASQIVIAGAFLLYLLDDTLLVRRYLWAGLSATVLVYLVTFWWWADFIQANPKLSFGKTWADLVFHINGSFWFLLPIVILYRKTQGWVRNTVVTALSFFFLSTFLKIPDILTGEAHKHIYTPVRNFFFLAGIPIFGYVYVRESVLELRRYTQRLEAEVRARTVAEQMAQAKGNFLATMSHEIRTPMNGVIGLAQLLSKTPLNDEQRSFVNTINQSGESTLQVLNDILDYTKIEAGRLEIEHLPFKLPALTQECKSLFLFQAGQSGVPIELLQNDIPSVVMGDPLRIRQVLTNLLGNAYKFTQKGHITLRVYSTPQSTRKTIIRFEVQDTGIGMTEDEQSRLFQAFAQADTSIARRFGGTGLGLSICYQLVKLMHGDIGVNSTPGKGSTFWFTVPLDMVPQAEPPLATPVHAVASKVVQQFPNLRILVAEDNAINQLVVSAQLKHMGAQPRMVNDGVEALNLLTTEHDAFDVVFMDCEMPHMDGYTATQHLRQWEQANQLAPVFICGASAHAMAEYRERALSLGMNAFITKPLRIEDLQRILELVSRDTQTLATV